MEWFDLPEEATPWLIHGMITSDDCAAACGKPKAGKSTAIRNIAVSVVLGRRVLDREVCLPPDTGRVLYLHLDRKDRKSRVAAELRKLGITKEAAKRLKFLTEADMPRDEDLEKRCEWLATQVVDFEPHLVIIDLLLHFVKTKKGVSDYDAMLNAIAVIQDAFTKHKYRGALLCSLHARKAVSEEVGDNVLGSTGIGGSLSTMLHFRRYRRENIYTMMSEQTYRDDILKELDETVINKDASGIISLGSKYEAIKQENKKDQWVIQRQKILRYVQNHPGKTSEDIATGVHITKPTVVSILATLVDSAEVKTFGAGVKGDPQIYFGDEPARKRHEESVSSDEPKAEVTALEKARKHLSQVKEMMVTSPHNQYWKNELPGAEQAVAKLEGL